MENLLEMAMERSDAIEKCNSLGKRFLEHFHKIYKYPNDVSVNHWAEEMQGWYGDVLNITFKHNKRPILKGTVKDWFLDCGSNPNTIIKDMTDDELEVYDKFCVSLLFDDDVKEALYSVGIFEKITV